jgi:CBS-domain-containing membrane protein
MSGDKESLKPIAGAERHLRRRLSLSGEFVLAALPTATILVVFAFVEVLIQQRLLFASLASSAFLIYLDPQHGTNSVRTLATAQMLAAVLGLATCQFIGPGYTSAALAMSMLIVCMILLDVVHPPAVATALSFALRAGPESNILLSGLAVGITVVLILMERTSLWLLARLH